MAIFLFLYSYPDMKASDNFELFSNITSFVTKKTTKQNKNNSNNFLVLKQKVLY